MYEDKLGLYALIIMAFTLTMFFVLEAVKEILMQIWKAFSGLIITGIVCLLILFFYYVIKMIGGV